MANWLRLRTEQDTINIIGIITNPPKASQKISRTHPRYYHLTFYLNNMTKSTDYMNGILNEKIKPFKTMLQENGRLSWDSSIILKKINLFLLTGQRLYCQGNRGLSGRLITVMFRIIKIILFLLSVLEQGLLNQPRQNFQMGAGIILGTSFFICKRRPGKSAYLQK